MQADVRQPVLQPKGGRMPRSTRPRLIIAFGLAATLVASLLAVPRPASADPLPWRDKGSPFGMVTAVGNRVRDDEIDRYVGLLREAGVQWSREEIFWDKVQHDPGGPYQWAGDGSGFYNYDHSIAAQASAGINILGLL